MRKAGLETKKRRISSLFLIFFLLTGSAALSETDLPVRPFVRCGGSFAIVRSDLGELYGWGDGRKGQLGNGQKRIVQTPQRLDWILPAPILDVQCGNENTLILLTDGTVWTCGSNDYGQQGTDGGHALFPVPIPELSAIRQIACGFGHNMALTEDGQVWVWGRGGNGQLGSGKKKNQTSPVLLDMPAAAQIECGGKYSICLMQDGSLYGFGDNEYGQLGEQPKKGNVLSPVRLTLLDGSSAAVRAIACGGDTAYALDCDGQLWAWGRNDRYQTGNADAGKQTNRAVPVQVPEGTDIREVHAYSGHTALITEQGGLMQWGHVSCGVRGCRSSPFKGLPGILSPETGVLDMDNGSLFVCILLDTGQVMTSGDNEYHQLGTVKWKPGVWADTGLRLLSDAEDGTVR